MNLQKNIATYWAHPATTLERVTITEAAQSLWLPVLYTLGGLWAVATSWQVDGFLWGQFWAWWVFLLLAIPLLLIDFKHLILPDILVWPGMVLGFICSPLLLNVPITLAITGALVGAGLFYAIRWVFWRLRGIEAMGLGDVKLMLMLGAWCGLSSLPLILLVSSLVGLLAFAGRYILKGTGGDMPLPFGPFLLAGGWLSLLYHDLLWSFLINWRGVLS